MSLKKRMFRSNMTILCCALVSLMLILVAVMVLFEDSFERQFHTLSQTALERHVSEAAQAVEAAQIEDVDELNDLVGQWGYQAAVLSGGRGTAGESGGHMSDVAEYFTGDQGGMDGHTDIFSVRGSTVAAKYVPEEDCFLAAVYFPEENPLVSSLREVFLPFLGMLVLAGGAAIVAILFLASFFTRKMNRLVMEPVEELVAGAERIRDGNLTEKIRYEGEEEFEHVCRTFNDMQHTILEDQGQREKNEKARTDMVTGISHDLRTPLTSIRGYIKGVLDGVADTEEKRELYLRTAYESTEDMNILLQKLFDFSRMESGQMPFHMVNVDPAEFTSVWIAQKEETFERSKVKFSFWQEKETMPEVPMDIDQIPRIFDNLLENSIKYAGVCPVEITVRIFEKVSEAPGEPTGVVIEWKDNGHGVPEEKLPQIFERFYRCDESRNEKGSGIGLYVVEYIMERHGGSVKAENDGGLKIQLFFPKEGM